jgi:hypothetical protein
MCIMMCCGWSWAVYIRRSMSSWMAQRVLEYSFRMRRMPADRLPAAVRAAVWRHVQGAKRPRMCGEELVRVEQHTIVNVTVAVADATVGYHTRP